MIAYGVSKKSPGAFKGINIENPLKRADFLHLRGYFNFLGTLKASIVKFFAFERSGRFFYTPN